MNIEPRQVLLIDKADSLSRQVVEEELTMPEAVNDIRRLDNMIVAAGENLRPFFNDAFREKNQSPQERPLTPDQQRTCNQLKQRLLAGLGIDWNPPELQIDRGHEI